MALEFSFGGTIFKEKGAKSDFCEVGLIGVESIHFLNGVPVSCLEVDRRPNF